MQGPDGSVRKRPPSRPSVLPDRPMRRARSSIEIQKFAEDDDEDFSDIFGARKSLVEKVDSERGSEDGGLMLLSKVSSNSWLGDDEDEYDPFASMDQGWDEMDLESNIARDRHARLAEKVESLISSLKTTLSEDILYELAEDMVCLVPNSWLVVFANVSGSYRCSGIIRRPRISSLAHTDCCQSWKFSSPAPSKAGST